MSPSTCAAQGRNAKAACDLLTMNLICSFLTFKALTGGLRRIWFRGKETLRSVDQFSKKKKTAKLLRKCPWRSRLSFNKPLCASSFPAAAERKQVCWLALSDCAHASKVFFFFYFTDFFFFFLCVCCSFCRLSSVIQGHSIFLKQAINNLNIGATLKGRIRLSGAYYGTNNFVIKESIAGTS